MRPKIPFPSRGGDWHHDASTGAITNAPPSAETVAATPPPAPKAAAKPDTARANKRNGSTK